MRRCLLAWVTVALLVGLASASQAVPRRQGDARATTQARSKSGNRPATKARFKSKAQSRADAKALAKAKAKAKADARAREAAAAIAAGKVAVFAFKGDDTEPVRTQVVQVLKAKGLDVTTTLRPVDSPEQYRDMAATLGLAVYVHGQVKDTAQDQAVATVLVRSGITGRRIATAKFSGDRRKLAAEVEEILWDRVGPAFARACLGATKPRRRHNAPMRIEAGTPIESTPRPDEGTQG